jgi:hypothetical protein
LLIDLGEPGHLLTGAEQLAYRVRMLLGICSGKGVLPLELKPVYSMDDLLTHHRDDLEHNAERNGGVLQALSEHFATIYRVAPVAA